MSNIHPKSDTEHHNHHHLAMPHLKACNKLCDFCEKQQAFDVGDTVRAIIYDKEDKQESINGVILEIREMEYLIALKSNADHQVLASCCDTFPRTRGINGEMLSTPSPLPNEFWEIYHGHNFDYDNAEAILQELDPTGSKLKSAAKMFNAPKDFLNAPEKIKLVMTQEHYKKE